MHLGVQSLRVLDSTCDVQIELASEPLQLWKLLERCATCPDWKLPHISGDA